MSGRGSVGHVDRKGSLWEKLARDWLHDGAKGASGLFSFKPRGGFTKRALATMLDGLRFFGMGYSWGGFESLAAPFRMNRYRPEMGDEETWGIRIHAGLENPQDLIADLEASFERLVAAA